MFYLCHNTGWAGEAVSINFDLLENFHSFFLSSAFHPKNTELNAENQFSGNLELQN